MCNKPLSCGKHNCDLMCHLGSCPKCAVYINYPIACNCGKTVKYPPLPCGTIPNDCPYPCIKKRECGHPCYANCHMDECPPCLVPISKRCVCRKNIIHDVPCSREGVNIHINLNIYRLIGISIKYV